MKTDTLEFSAFTTHLQTVYKDLFRKLDIYEWEDVYELLMEDAILKSELDHLRDVWTEEVYEDARVEIYDDAYDEGFRSAKEQILTRIENGF